MTKAQKTTETPEVEVAPTPEPEIIGVKGFDMSLRCRDHQFEVGKTYEHVGKVEACEGGFHAIEGNPLEVFGYYPPGQSRYAIVRQSGALSRHSSDSKLASAKITIDAEINIPTIVTRAIDWIISKTTPSEAKHSEGNQSAASSTGYRSAASSTGDGSAASSTGNRSAASSTGDGSAASSTGDESAASSTGNRSAASSTGNRSAASSTGDGSAASSTGDGSAASSTGYRSAASSTGNRSAASSTGNRSAASSTGDGSAASSTGDRSAASSTGDGSAAMSAGYEGRVMAAEGCAIFLVYRDANYNILHAWAGIAGRDGIEPLQWYQLGADGKPFKVS
jgi:hypothetical protein